MNPNTKTTSLVTGNRMSMNIETLKRNGLTVAIVTSDELIITDPQSALDLAMTVKYETGCTNIAISKDSIVDDFFVLSTRLAGEILQKFINYGVRLAIFGDFSKYTSKPLKDFIYESNRGKSFYFQPDCPSAVEKLCGARDKRRDDSR